MQATVAKVVALLLTTIALAPAFLASRASGPSDDANRPPAAKDQPATVAD